MGIVKIKLSGNDVINKDAPNVLLLDVTSIIPVGNPPLNEFICSSKDKKANSLSFPLTCTRVGVERFVPNISAVNVVL